MKESTVKARLSGRIVVVFAAAFLTAVSSVSAAAFNDRRFDEGTHRIGKSDVLPGTYRSLGGDTCYWSRLKNFSGEIGGILANEIASGPTVATIMATDRGFDSTGCARWTSNLKRITKSRTSFGEGIYIVKTDIAPGTYRSKAGADCYWARLRNFTGGTISGVIANGIGSAHPVVTIKATDKGFKSSGCGTWTRF
jgi:hypothetical protein